MVNSKPKRWMGVAVSVALSCHWSWNVYTQGVEITDKIQLAINTGEQAEITRTLQEATIEDLLLVAHELVTGQWGDESAKLKPMLLRELRARPEHAKIVGDRIDERANGRGMEPFVAHDFRILEFIGSQEALEQLGRFLWDDRVPEPQGFRDPEAGFSSTPLKTRAAWELCVYLGNRAPVQANARDFYKGGVEKIQQWYKENENNLKVWEKPVDARLKLPPRPQQQHGGDNTMINNRQGSEPSDIQRRRDWSQWVSAVILGVSAIWIGVRWWHKNEAGKGLKQ